MNTAVPPAVFSMDLEDLGQRPLNSRNNNRKYVKLFGGLQKVGLNIVKPFREPSRDLWNDLKAVTWLRVVKWSAFAAWLFVLLLFIFILFNKMVYVDPLADYYSSYYVGVCGIDATFSVDGGVTKSDWWIRGFFDVTMPFGSFPFALAKIIDVIWDTILGRIGQAVLSYFTWTVFADYIAVSLVTTPIRYTTFWFVFLQREPSINAWFQLSKDICMGRVLKSKLTRVFMIVVITYIMLFPAIIGSMTGYTPATEAFVQTTDAAFVPFSKFRETVFVVHDGSRIQVGDEYLVNGPATYADQLLGPDAPSTDDTPDYKYMLNAIYLYISSYGFYGLHNSESIFNNTIHLPAPALNISAFYFFHDSTNDYDPAGVGWDWTDPRTGGHPFRNPANRQYVLYNQTYHISYIKNNGACQPARQPCTTADDSDTTGCPSRQFQWGFSVAQLCISMVSLVLWSVGLYLVWLKANMQLPLEGMPEVPRGWMALIILGDAIRAELSAQEIDPSSLTDDELKKKISEHLRGGAVSLSDKDLKHPGYSLRRGFLVWLKREKWWFAALCISLATFLGTLLALAYFQGPLSNPDVSEPPDWFESLEGPCLWFLSGMAISVSLSIGITLGGLVIGRKSSTRLFLTAVLGGGLGCIAVVVLKNPQALQVVRPFLLGNFAGLNKNWLLSLYNKSVR
ncbi:hypothetical protein B0T17DRAFT_602313 [Bombardia bombarda]|uniref:Uncharacterized protein n=1 Tax=Bombardia bombarda TaxID=252184 RepID=A0AA40BVK8_9PEZI|nr:hypothetical protein B0T17DRAFT_602313 [Bombardia bombarda]